MSIWDDLGFRENPYSTDPVPPNQEGIRLLVGRKAELERLRMSITSFGNHTTIEGANGVGKTSLVGIAAYTLFEDFNADPQRKPMFIPVQNPFQLDASTTAQEFSGKFVLTLAREVVSRRFLLEKHHGKLAALDDLDRWLNDPVMRAGGAGVSILGSGGNVTSSMSYNTTHGFAQVGVEAKLREVLSAVFPRRGYGGFVCVLDNLELLDTSGRARETLETLRDGVLAMPGVKWVLCGARGIVRSVVSTPRLQGKLLSPLELTPLVAEQVKAAIDQRLEVFKTSPAAYTPVEADGFAKIYAIANNNLRIALKFCEDFVLWCMLSGNRPDVSIDKIGLLDVWFAQSASETHQDTTGIGARAWEVFDYIGSRREGISPGDFEELGFASGQAMQPHLRALEHAALLESSTDDTDRRRKTVTLTPKGWIVRYERMGFTF